MTHLRTPRGEILKCFIVFKIANIYRRSPIKNDGKREKDTSKKHNVLFTATRGLHLTLSNTERKVPENLNKLHAGEQNVAVTKGAER